MLNDSIYLQSLKNIRSTSHRLLQSLERAQPAQTSTTQDHPPSASPFVLPEPVPIRSDVIGVGLDPSTASQLCAGFLRSARDLKHEYEQKIEVALGAYTGPDTSTGTHRHRLCSLFTTRYTQTLQHWKSAIMTLAMQRFNDQENGENDSIRRAPMHEKRFKSVRTVFGLL